jgi:hypothetical protein
MVQIGATFMRRKLLILGLLISWASPCLALSQQSSDFVRSIGIDPASADVVAADKDGTIATTFHGDPASNSLETLASEKKVNAVKRFIFTRKLVRDLKVNPSGPLPAVMDNYDALYLTDSEKVLVGRKAVEEIAAKAKRQKK